MTNKLTPALTVDMERALWEVLDRQKRNSAVAAGIGRPKQAIEQMIKRRKVSHPTVDAFVAYARAIGLDIPHYRFRPDMFEPPAGYVPPPVDAPIPGLSEREARTAARRQDQAASTAG